MKMIVACDDNYGIGYQNDLLFKIPEDMKNFVATTKNHVVVMGRKTFESMGCNALPNRINIVITSNDKEYAKYHHTAFIHSMDNIDEELDNYDDDDVFIIGGASIYNAFIDKCDEIILTHYHKKYENVDTYFPIPEEHGFVKDKVILSGTHEDIGFEICSYIKSSDL